MLRLESRKRWWAADIALRLTGLMLIGLCALAVGLLYRSVHQPPWHPARTSELFAGLVAVLGWCVGSSLLAAGQGLFEFVAVPGRFPPTLRGTSR